MSRAQIFITYILIDLAIVGFVVWCFFQHVPVRTFFLPAAALFVAGGIWLIWATIRSMPQKPGS